MIRYLWGWNSNRWGCITNRGIDKQVSIEKVKKNNVFLYLFINFNSSKTVILYFSVVFILQV